LNQINTINNITNGSMNLHPQENGHESTTEIEGEKIVNESDTADILDHYKFLVHVRNQFVNSNPFLNPDEAQLKQKNFKAIFAKLGYHYKELMTTLDCLSNEAKAIMEIYKD
jgi:hypothetical protein